MASMSGSLVPPTWGSSGCSQNRVQAAGGWPQLMRVSVADGTRLTMFIGWDPLHRHSTSGIGYTGLGMAAGNRTLHRP